MDAAQILRELAVEQPLPVEAIRAAEADRAAMVPIFLEAIEQRVSNGGRGPDPDPLFFGFHMLGAWREKSAYRPLARLLRLPSDALHDVIGEAVTETSHRVMTAVFDGDPTPLYQIVLDEEADEFVRSRMCEAVAMVTLRGELSREEAARFLRACYTEIRPQGEYFVWDGWQSAIAMLGLVELEPLVEQAFARGFISPSWLDFEDFEGDLQAAIEGRAPPAGGPDDQYAVFGDTIEELSTWACFRPSEEWKHGAERKQDTVGVRAEGFREWGVPARNPLRHVGRNDPCPCGSGKKFKKCCLTADAGLATPIEG